MARSRFEEGLYKKFDQFFRFGMEAMEDRDCAKAFKAIVRANAAYGAIQGSLVGRFGGSTSAVRQAQNDPDVRDMRRMLNLLETSYQERCWGGREMLHGLGGGVKRRHTASRVKMLSERIRSVSEMEQRISDLLQTVREHLDSGDCVETFYAIRDTANYIMFRTALIKMIARGGQATGVFMPGASEKSTMKYLAPLEALEREFVEECVKGGMGRARDREVH